MAARYVAIIMDGNARWAAEHELPVLEGHRRGAQTLKQTVRNAVSLEIEELTVYAFSTENWTRPQWEVESHMPMFAELIESETCYRNEESGRARLTGRPQEVSGARRSGINWGGQ